MTLNNFIKWISLFQFSIGIAATPTPNSSPTPPPAEKLGGPESVSKSRYMSVVGTKGMVVSDDRVASAWGAEVLRQGGNAIDAAVATSFAMAVTRPHYASIGGGGFMIYCPKPTQNGPSTCQALDYREKAPAAAHRNLFIRNGKAETKLAQDGALASGVPGVPAGLLTALSKYGTWPRQKLLKHPIELAKKGYIFSSHSETAANSRWSAMNPAAKKIFGCGPGSDGIPAAPCPPGTLIKQPDLARVLEAISKHGRKGFYEGPFAKKIVEGLRQAGGIMTLKDMTTYEPKWREVIKATFHGHEIISMPPPSSGGAIVLQLLGYAERAEKSGGFKDGYGSVNSIHSVIHGMSLAFADRAMYLGDPDFNQIPLSTILSQEYLDRRWKTFDLDEANLPNGAGDLGHEPSHTTHFAVIDRHGNAVSITTTVNDNFGSGFVPPGTGVVMNNEMDDFSVEPGVPNLFGLIGSEANSVGSEKRPLSSMSPTIVRNNRGEVEIAIGAAGGPRIITSVYLSLLNRLQFGMSLVDAVASPRFHQQWRPMDVKLERFGFAPETRAALHIKGYQTEEVPTLGKVHAIERLGNGRTVGVPDFRGEGAAVAE